MRFWHGFGRVAALAAALFLFAASAGAVDIDPLLPRATAAYPDGLLERLREAATVVPGPLPAELRYASVAESHRPRRAVLEGGSEEIYVQARTAFQLVYDDTTVMVDAGMDEQVHRGFSMGTPEPYFPQVNDAVQKALVAASLVVVTHEHGDHVAGVVRSADRETIAAHTVLTKAQIDTLILAPQSVEIRLTPAQAADYIVVDYGLYLPVAPGIVLLKAPGHTPGHQMVYARLRSGREYLLSGDVSWALEGIRTLTQRPVGTSDRIREDRDAIALQLAWLGEVMDQGDVVIVPSHDAVYLGELEERGLLREGLVTD